MPVCFTGNSESWYFLLLKVGRTTNDVKASFLSFCFDLLTYVFTLKFLCFVLRLRVSLKRLELKSTDLVYDPMKFGFLIASCPLVQAGIVMELLLRSVLC